MAVPTVIAISRQFGAGGARVGRDVARRLGFQYVDREILAEAAQRLHVETNQLEPLEERVRGFWERLACTLGDGAIDAPFPPLRPSVVPEELLAVERQIIETVAGRGQAVIVGRGAAHLLRGRSGVLKVFLHAPSAPRIELAMGEYGLPNRGEAERIVRINDADRARFVRSLTGRDWCDATLYDITLDTSITGFEKAANAIIALVQP